MVHSMSVLEAALRTSKDQSFELARTEINKYLPIVAWEVALNDDGKPWFGEMAVTASKEAPGEVKNHCIECHRIEKHDLIAREMKSIVKEVVANKMATLVKEALEDDFRMALH